MRDELTPKLRDGFCIYIDTFCQGPVPVVSDENGYCIFETELEAQREIVDNQMNRLQQFLDWERDYEDAIAVARVRRACYSATGRCNHGCGRKLFRARSILKSSPNGSGRR